MLTNILMVFNLAVKNVFSNWGKNKTIVTILAVSLILIQFLISLSEGFGLQVKTFALDSLVGDLKIINPKSRVDSSIKLNFVIDDSTLDKISKIDINFKIFSTPLVSDNSIILEIKFLSVSKLIPRKELLSIFFINILSLNSKVLYFSADGIQTRRTALRDNFC
jgi:hypothetical protein